MAKLRIRIYKNDNPEPSQTISIPLAFLKLAVKMAPKKIKKIFEDKGLDLSTLADIVKKTDPQGVIAEIEDHETNEKTVISVE
ncbi:MAG: hypothetical protein JXJ19_05275 [Elusimicrobia bacterium]|nr:hypothetical protein [Elusimicrobiota bacterium]